MANLAGLGIENENPVQSDGQFCNPPTPCAVKVVITDAEVKDMKDNKGRNLVVTYQILAHSFDNSFNGQDLGVFYSLWAHDPETVKIARRKFSPLCHTLGLAGIQDTSELLGQELILVLDRKNPSDTFVNVHRVLNANGQKLVDSAGNFAPYDEKHADEVVKLYAVLNGQAVNPNQNQQQGNFNPQGGAGQSNFTPQGGNFGGQSNNNFGQPQGSQPNNGGNFTPNFNPQGGAQPNTNFGQPPFAGNPNPNNGFNPNGQ